MASPGPQASGNLSGLVALIDVCLLRQLLLTVKPFSTAERTKTPTSGLRGQKLHPAVNEDVNRCLEHRGRVLEAQLVEKVASSRAERVSHRSEVLPIGMSHSGLQTRFRRTAP